MCLSMTVWMWQSFDQDFVGAWKGKDMNQNKMLVARDNRQKLKKDLSKFQLNYLNLKALSSKMDQAESRLIR